ncbi:lipopolysaccharide biosynthesis protein [Anaerolineales bacterium HSG6]|nr:lipopolysaccharide biosynthesis protein [Anaerolineales bacterium HSG6]MDM8531056.1 lipopolysaccharide biosynthesis protein [Anaerolineales bacterium HSG25]
MLKVKMVQGLVWVAGSAIIIRTFNFLATLTLARILVPSDFGIIAVIDIVINVTQVFRDLGLGRALIHRTGNMEKASNTIFFLVITWGFCLSMIIILCADYIAMFFSTPETTSIIQIMATTIFISSIGLVPATILEKNLAFNKKVVPEIVPVLIYACLAVILASVGFGVWSIVWARVLQSILTTVLLWLACDWRLTIEFDYQLALETLQYGQHVIAASALTVAFLYIDNAYIAHHLGMTSLGYYAFAFMLANLPMQSVTPIISKVTFPSYVQLRDDRAKLIRAYLQSIKLTALITFPATFGLAILVDDVILLLYADKWVNSIVLVQILCFYALFRSVGALPGSVLYTIGKHHVIPRFMVVYILFLLLCLWPATLLWGTIGVAITMTSVMIVGSTVWLIAVNYYLQISTKQFITTIFPQTIASITMTFILLYLNRFITGSIGAIILMVLTGVIVYTFMILWLTKGQVYKDVMDILITLRGKHPKTVKT